MGLITNLDLSSRLQSTRTALAALDTAAIMATLTQTFAKARTEAWPTLCELSDPRGRCNRQAFLTIALAFLAIQFAVAALLWLFDIETSNTTNLLLNAPIAWIGSTVCLKRLHDVGLRGWWLPGAATIWLAAAMLFAMIISIVLGEDALQQGQPAFFAVFAVITLPAFGALLWLHTAPSTTTANRFGPATGPRGLSMPERKQRSAKSVMPDAALIA
jgi:uncharacterized membrane protein YhaH (DUF805 family)